MQVNTEYLRNDEELTADLIDEVEALAGPRFRRIEERADGRDLMDCWEVLAHTDVEVSSDNVTRMAATLIRERTTWIGTLREEGQFEEFEAHYMEEDR